MDQAISVNFEKHLNKTLKGCPIYLEENKYFHSQ